MKLLITRITKLLFKLALEIKSAVASTIADATGKKVRPSQIEAVIGLYDPIKASINDLR
jgi:hypothetical protein